MNCALVEEQLYDTDDSSMTRCFEPPDFPIALSSADWGKFADKRGSRVRKVEVGVNKHIPSLWSLSHLEWLEPAVGPNTFFSQRCKEEGGSLQRLWNVSAPKQPQELRVHIVVLKVKLKWEWGVHESELGRLR